MDKNLDQIKVIINELYNEFKAEEQKLSQIYDSNSVKVDELEHRISNSKKNEDVDYKVFSPRNISTVNSEKIIELENEKNILEKELSFTSKQLKYYSDKAGKLEKVLELLNLSTNSVSFVDSIIESNDSNENESTDSFDELFPNRQNKTHNTLDNNDTEIVNEDDNEDIQLFKDLFSSSESENKDSSDDSNSIEETSDNKSDIVLPSANDDKTLSLIDDENVSNPDVNNISKGSIARIIHRIEFTEKIIVNDSVRAKIEIKEILNMLRKLL